MQDWSKTKAAVRRTGERVCVFYKSKVIADTEVSRRRLWQERVGLHLC